VWAEDLDTGTLAQLARAYARRKRWEAGLGVGGEMATAPVRTDGRRKTTADGLMASMGVRV